jgi:hypothetical protein
MTRSPSPLTPSESAYLVRLADLADRLHASGQPGIAEELDRAASVVREMARRRAVDGVEMTRLRRLVDEMRKAAVKGGTGVAVGSGKGTAKMRGTANRLEHANA